MPKIEEILGKPIHEIAFGKNSQAMIDFAERFSKHVDPPNRPDFFRSLAHHYRTLARLDGIRGDMVDLAEKYFDHKIAKAVQEAAEYEKDLPGV